MQEYYIIKLKIILVIANAKIQVEWTLNNNYIKLVCIIYYNYYYSERDTCFEHNREVSKKSYFK